MGRNQCSLPVPICCTCATQNSLFILSLHSLLLKAEIHSKSVTGMKCKAGMTSLDKFCFGDSEYWQFAHRKRPHTVHITWRKKWNKAASYLLPGVYYAIIHATNLKSCVMKWSHAENEQYMIPGTETMGWSFLCSICTRRQRVWKHFVEHTVPRGHRYCIKREGSSSYTVHTNGVKPKRVHLLHHELCSP